MAKKMPEIGKIINMAFSDEHESMFQFRQRIN